MLIETNKKTAGIEAFQVTTTINYLISYTALSADTLMAQMGQIFFKEDALHAKTARKVSTTKTHNK